MLAQQKCSFCNKHAPSHSKFPPAEAQIHSVPFEAIVSDFFDMLGFHYLVIADSLTGWPEVYRVKVGTKEAGASGLVALLKRFCGTFDVPVEVSCDGGPEFAAHETQDFFKWWGIKCRMSSAYHP